MTAAADGLAEARVGPSARREHILDAAEACFTRNGFHRTTMQDLAREAAMSPGNFYRYFESKEALVLGLVERERERGTLLVAASAIPTAAGTAVLLRLVDPAQAPLPDTAALRDQFGFTPAEAALAVDILAGNDLATSAQRRGTTRNTARAHLRHLFEKTGTRRQAELMRLLLLSPQPIAGTAGREIMSRGSISSPNGGCEYPIIQRR